MALSKEARLRVAELHRMRRQIENRMKPGGPDNLFALQRQLAGVVREIRRIEAGQADDAPPAPPPDTAGAPPLATPGRPA